MFNNAMSTIMIGNLIFWTISILIVLGVGGLVYEAWQHFSRKHD